MKKVIFLGVEYEVADYIKFIARDPDGEIWGFDKQPEINNEGNWYARNGHNAFIAPASITNATCMEIK